MKLVRSLVASFAILVPSVSASTWVVDVTPGPGVDFTSISDATAVAVTGDVILVRAGTYGGFTLSTSAVVLGEPGATVNGDVHVANNALLGHAALVHLTLQSLYVDPSSGGVLLEDLVVRPGTIASGQSALVQVSGGYDVRLRDVDVDGILQGIAAVSITSSRVEIAGGRFVGGKGRSHDPIGFPLPPENGGDGIVANGSSDVHVSRAEARGGAGGDLPAGATCGCLIAGHGGIGIRVNAGAKLLLTGPSSALVKGGAAGIGIDCPYDGRPGNGVVVDFAASARVSGATVVGESSRAFCGGFPASPIVGPYTVPGTPDPTLSVSGVLAAGQLVTYTLTGTPGLSARVYFGRILSVTDLPFVSEDRLTLPIRSFNLGVIPPSGQVSLTILLPSYLPRGFLVSAQGEATTTLGDVFLSPSAPITLR